MKRAVLALALLGAAPAFGQEWKDVDCSRLERKIENEPKYKTEKPGYALFLLDAEGKFPVWFVLDGDDLYVANKKFESKKEDGRKTRTWALGEIAVPGTKIVHTELHLGVYEGSESEIRFSMKWAGTIKVYAGDDLTTGGCTKWGSSPKTAPVLRPCPLGPLELVFGRKPELKTGEAHKVYLEAGHKGSGPEAFSDVNDEYLEAGKDRIFVTLIGKDAKGNEVKVRTEIKEHC